MMNDLELLFKVKELEKENEEVLRRLTELENALFLAMDYQALGLARCLEQELINAKSALAKSALYNIQLNNIIKTKYGG